MVVLVTGAAGFIGSHVVHLLLSEGRHVRATVRDVQNAQFLKSFPQHADSSLEIVQMDLLEVDSVHTAVSGCDTVVHCAASLMVDVKDPQRDVVDPSVAGTQNLCEAIRGNDAVHTVIHTSSVAAIRRTRYEDGETFTSNDWCDDASLQSNPYGLAKAEAERKMRAFIDQCNASTRKIRLVTIHPSIVFGPIFHERHARGSMAYLKHYRGKMPFVLNAHLNFVDVRDVAQAHVNAIENGQDGGRYIVHKTGLWMKGLGVALRRILPERKWPVARLPTLLALVMAGFHPKLTVKQVRSSTGRHVNYDIQDTEQMLGINLRSIDSTLTDSMESFEELSRKV
ncbi:NAD-dependent epimerase/dehydratase family protein [Euryarchaeota archaeon]|nr:NAD-dependent epimerase/dehydratase family protein [Euryarchaeota archaeon]